MRIDGSSAEPAPGVVPESTVIPEPRVARQFNSVLAPGGRRAMTWPSDPNARGDILIWNLAGGEILARIPRPANFSDARFARGQSGIFITARNLAELWDIERVEKSASITIEPSFVPVMSANGYMLVVDTVLEEGDDALSIWDLEKPGEIGSLVTGNVADLVAVDSTGQYLAVSDGERLVRLWSVSDNTLVGEFDHASRPVSLRFDASGRWLITDDAAHQLRAWPIGEGDRPVITRQAGSAWSVSLADEVILLGTLGRGFELLELPRGVAQGELFHHGVPLGRRTGDDFSAPTALSTTSGFAATYDGREVIKLWRLSPSLAPAADAAERPQQPPVEAPSIAAAIGPAGARMAIATNAGDVRILGGGQQALLLPDAGYSPGFIGHLDRITRTVFDASGELLASGSFDGSVRVWETASGAPRSFFSNHTDGAIHDLVFTPDGRYIVSATRRSVLVTNAATGEQLAETLIQSERPRLTTSADGEQIYIAADRGGLTRWLWRGNVSETLIKPGSGIKLARVSADGSVIVTVDRKRKVVAWDAASMQPRDRSFRAAVAVDDLFLAPDGGRLLVQAGVWLNLLTITPGGMTREITRRLDYPPTAVASSNADMLAQVMIRPHASQPVIREINLTTPAVEPFENSLEQFVPLIETQLSLTLNDWGDPQPTQ